MNAEIIAVGTELLLGSVVNTNATFLSQRLASVGINVFYHTTVGDNPERIQEAIRLALTRSDIIITSGGLGPTVDDITMPMIAKAIGRRMIFNEKSMAKIREYFRHRGIRKITGNVKQQAFMPEGAVCLVNNFGTAAGVAVHVGKAVIIALPGPPRELEPMFDNEIIPYLKKNKYTGTDIIKTRTIKLTGGMESLVDSRAKDLLRLSGRTTVGIYSKPGMVELKITAKAKKDSEAERHIKPIEREIERRFGQLVFGKDDDTLEGVVGRMLLKKRLTISLAESCTGGLVSHRITNISGSSKYYADGVVSYANAAKESLLSVSEKTLKRYGAVSRQIALEMARGIRNVSGTDIGLALTGIAGPTGGSKKKPVGLVFIAIVTDDRKSVKEYRFTGGRETIKWRASCAALDLIRLTIMKI